MLNLKDYPELVNDLGLIQKGKQKRRYGMFSCITCGSPFKSRFDHIRLGYTGNCRVCKTLPIKDNLQLRLVLKSMFYRCNYVKGYKCIEVCDEWYDVETFISWALAHDYLEGLHIHRLKNDKDYQPDNCVFLTASEHAKLHK